MSLVTQPHMPFPDVCFLLSGKSVKDLSTVVECVHSIIDYSRKLQRLSNEDDLIPGLGMVGGSACPNISWGSVKQ